MLGDSHVLLHSAQSEGISNALLEGMASSLVAVTTDCGGARDGVEGFVVPTRDADALAAALLKVAGDRERARAMGEAGRRRILKQHTLDQQADAFYELYAQLAAR